MLNRVKLDVFEKWPNESMVRSLAPGREIPPSQTAALRTARRLAEELDRGRNVIIHCRQGIGRSALMAALVFAAAGIQPTDALRRIGAARGLSVPETQAQREWIDCVAPFALAPARLS